MATLTDCHRQRLEQAAQVVANMDAQFNMNWWFDDEGHERTPQPSHELLHSCNTTACLGGTMNALFFPGREELWQVVGQYVGLDVREANQLFFPEGVDRYGNGHLECTDAKLGAAVLRHLAQTGEVDWPGVTDRYHAERELDRG